MKPDSVFQSKPLRIFYISSGILAAAMIVVIFVLLATQKTRKDFTLNEYIAIVAVSELGGKTNMEKVRVRNFEIDDKIRVITLNADENLTKKLAVTMCELQTVDVMKKLVQDKEFMEINTGISFRWVFEFSNKYGETSEVVGMIITFMPEEINRIQWDNALLVDVKEVAHTYWVNDFLQ